MKTRQRRFGGLFWRMALSYLAVSVVATLIAIPASRYEGPFDFLRDSDLVHTFNRFFDNQTNGTFLIIAVIALIGLVTGALISANLRGRIVRIAAAAQAWSQGDFSSPVRDRSGDELGQLARDLNRMAEQIQTLLASRQALAVVEERNRLARDLHDTVKQHVFANALLVRAARKQLDRDPAAARARLEEAEQLAEQTQQELINLIGALRPAALADKGLMSMLRAYAEEWSQRTGIAVDLRAQGERLTPLDVEEAYYRVAQEALTNVARHSGASHVEIQLTWADDTLEMTVRDDGQGFVVEESAGKGFGLASMRERIEALGGALTISSGASRTCLEARAPLAGDIAQQVEAGA
ncbi:MAG TPA: sensor histidine kinase [Ktedonobacterales bacterium]|jgi:signal transduction histidine kinase